MLYINVNMQHFTHISLYHMLKFLYLVCSILLYQCIMPLCNFFFKIKENESLKLLSCSIISIYTCTTITGAVYAEYCTLSGCTLK